MASALEQMALAGVPMNSLQIQSDDMNRLIRNINEPVLSSNLTIKTKTLECYFDTIMEQYESSDDEGSEYDENVFKKLLEDCHSIGVDYQQVLRDLGLQIPPNVFSNEFLEPFCNKIHLELAECKYPRTRLPNVFSFDHALQLIKRCRRIVVICGAGISVASGIPDFRSEGGIYSQLGKYNLSKPTDMFDLEFFRQNPIPFFKFAPEIIPCSKYKPTFTHQFLKLLDDQNKILRIYTQNIDCLEEQVGIQQVKIVNCHGTFATATCQQCGHKVLLKDYRDPVLENCIPLCNICGKTEQIGKLSIDYAQNNPQTIPKYILKPDIVFFGEKLPDTFLNNLDDDLQVCDLLLVMGSSLRVKPIAGLLGRTPRYVPQILVNRERVQCAHQFDVELIGFCDIALALIASRLGHDELIKKYNETVDQQQKDRQQRYQLQNIEYNKRVDMINKLQIQVKQLEIDEFNCKLDQTQKQNLQNLHQQLFTEQLNQINQPTLSEIEKITVADWEVKPYVANLIHVHKITSLIKYGRWKTKLEKEQAKEKRKNMMMNGQEYSQTTQTNAE